MIAILPYLFGAIVTTAADPSHLAIENCQVSEMYAFNHAECDVTLSNDGDKPIRVFDVKATKEGDSAEPATLTIAAHAHAYLKVKIDSSNGFAASTHKIQFHTDERGHEERSAAAGAFVVTVLDDARPQIDFGVVKSFGEPSRKSVELSSHDVAELKITKILEAPAWLDASIGADGKTLSATVKADAGWGLHADFVKVMINAPQQSQAWIEVKADVHGEVVPASNPLDMSLMRIGAPHEFHVPLHGKKAFQVGKIELEGMHGTTQLEPCEKTGGTCQMLVLKVEDQQPGSIKGHVWIELPEFHQRLHLAVWGLLVPKDSKVKNLDEMRAAQETVSGEGQSPTKSLDLQHAVKAAVSTAANTNVAPPPGTGPLLKWTIANGQAIHGFQIFRSSDENGPFVLLNQKSIPSTAQSQDSVSYQWRDTSATSGKTYWYYIGILYNDGHKQQLTGAQKVVAK